MLCVPKEKPKQSQSWRSIIEVELHSSNFCYTFEIQAVSMQTNIVDVKYNITHEVRIKSSSSMMKP